MKKHFLIFLGLLILLQVYKIPVRASDNNWDHFPKGENYIDPNNHIATDLGNYEYILETINPFRIKEAREYSIFITYAQINQFYDCELIFYDSEDVVIENDIEYNAVKDSQNRIIAYNFYSPNYAFKVKFILHFKHDRSFPENYKEELDQNLVFCEGTIYPGPLDVPIGYEGPGEDLEPVIEGEYGFYITNVNNPISVNKIKAGLRAIDDNDGDVTDSIIVFEDNYTDNKNKLGLYEVTFRANDKSNNYSYFTIFIEVIDTDAPTIGGKLKIDAVNSDLYDLELIKSGLVLTDNYDSPNEIILELIEDNYSANFDKVGIYEILYKATDTSGNESTKAVVVEVKDNIKPVIEGPMNHIKSNKLTVDVIEFLSLYTATDETDGNITNKIVIIKDNYTNNQYKKGIWDVELSVSDNSGNKTTITISIEVIDEIGPVFFIDKTKIVIDLTTNPVTINELVGYFQKANIIKEDTIIEIIEDNYSSNKDKPGKYRVLLGYMEEQLEIEVEVLEEILEIKKPTEASFFRKIFNFFNRIFRKIFNFFKLLFY